MLKYPSHGSEKTQGKSARGGLSAAMGKREPGEYQLHGSGVYPNSFRVDRPALQDPWRGNRSWQATFRALCPPEDLVETPARVELRHVDFEELCRRPSRSALSGRSATSF